MIYAENLGQEVVFASKYWLSMNVNQQAVTLRLSITNTRLDTQQIEHKPLDREEVCMLKDRMCNEGDLQGMLSYKK